jgi:uncharacterized protein YqfA (UPF0365 family)
MNLLSIFSIFLARYSGGSGSINTGAGVLIVIGIIVALVILGVILNYLSIWMQAFASGAHVSFFELIGMQLRHVDPKVIINSRIMALKAGIKVTTDMLESHYLARGNVLNVVRALIAASRANIPLTFQKAAAIDLAGRNVLDAVQTSVNPKVIDCPASSPNRSSNTIDAVAKDGIQLKAKARVTVRANLDRLVGGATEETIIARVGEGIVTTIGSAENYKSVLENPVRISKTVLQKGLDAGTAFEILSIDIADIDVGINIGAQLQADQAEADKKIAQAKAEERRAMAVAMEQEKLAEIQENQAKVVLAEAEIPKAIAEAFNEGKISLMDYYKLRNVMADTSMRSAIAGDNSSTFKV